MRTRVPICQMKELDTREAIWAGDRLGRRHEADTIESYIVAETAALARLKRSDSIVLGIDAPYGRGKTWFLDRLARQLQLSHPVARVNAWADDAGDEPLTAFMAAIDEALAPYLTSSGKLRDKLAAAKAAALPVMGKLVSGALIKALTKVAGDEIEDQLGTAVEDAVRSAKGKESSKDGAASAAMEAALEKLGTEIDSLVDRRGAAMLAAYRQRKQSREVFRRNMHELVIGIDASKGPGIAPLIVVVDELDRCRPDYALRMLEEIKHFFDVPGVVFLVGLHGAQLSKSIKAVYGSEFDSNDYLRRFFTRKYELRPHSVVEMAAAMFEEWGLEAKMFKFPEAIVPHGYPLTTQRVIGLLLAQWNVTPREITAVMDGLRLFANGWEHAQPIEPVFLLALLVHLVRDEQLDSAQIPSTGQLSFKGYVVQSNDEKLPSNFQPNQFLASISPLAWQPLDELHTERKGQEPARNYLLDWLEEEMRSRYGSHAYQSHLVDYIPRLADLARFLESPGDVGPTSSKAALHPARE